MLVKGNKKLFDFINLKYESAKQIGMVVNLGSRCVCAISRTSFVYRAIDILQLFVKVLLFFSLLGYLILLLLL